MIISSLSTEEGFDAAKVSHAEEITINSRVVDSPTPAPATKKKKKTSYKSMMAGMLEEKSRDIEKEKEKLRALTGGGNFQKIDKI